MPAIPKTSDEEVVRAARRLVEKSGLDALSMQAVAEAVGVRAPSLYKRFPDRAALVEAVTLSAISDLRDALTASSRSQSPTTGLRALGRAFRAFALQNPRLYPLLFTAGPPGDPAVAARATAAEPLFDAIARAVRPDHVLSAARTFTAYVHGFCSMELAGAFRLGGSIDEAFTTGLDILIHGLARSGRR
jgi:AcrR family transcriptional regulator